MYRKVVPYGLNRCSEALEKINVHPYVGYWPIGVFDVLLVRTYHMVSTYPALFWQITMYRKIVCYGLKW